MSLSFGFCFFFLLEVAFLLAGIETSGLVDGCKLIFCLLVCFFFFVGPSCSDLKQPAYSGFEKDVFKTIVDYFGQMKEPLLTFHFFDVFVSVLGK